MLNFNKINRKNNTYLSKICFIINLIYSLPNLIWTGTKACKKKDLINPQWLRNIKDRKYSFYRIDTFFSKKNIKA